MELLKDRRYVFGYLFIRRVEKYEVTAIKVDD